MLLVDEICLQPDLVGADRIIPVASVAAGRDLTLVINSTCWDVNHSSDKASAASTVWYLPGCIGWHLACWTP